MKKNHKIIKKIRENYLKPLFLLAVLVTFTWPTSTLSQETDSLNLDGPRGLEVIKPYYNGPTLPKAPAREARRTMHIVVTSYNSEPGQTDDTPFITASGTHTRDGIIAANFLPIGAIVRFPEIFGEKEFIVEDRMNKRYYYRADIWMAEKRDAVKFGAKYLKIEIL